MFLLDLLFPKKHPVLKLGGTKSVPRILRGVSSHRLSQMVLHWICPFCRKKMVFYRGNCQCDCDDWPWVAGKNNETKDFIRTLQSKMKDEGLSLEAAVKAYRGNLK